MISSQSIESEKWSQLADCLGVHGARRLTRFPRLARFFFFLGSWTSVCEKDFITDLTMLFNFSFSLLKPLPLHQIFQTGNIKCTLIRRHMFLRVGSVCVESSPGLSLASTCDSLYSLYLFKQDRRFNAESLMDVGKLWKACADCHFFFFFFWLGTTSMHMG